MDNIKKIIQLLLLILFILFLYFIAFYFVDLNINKSSPIVSTKIDTVFVEVPIISTKIDTVFIDRTKIINHVDTLIKIIKIPENKDIVISGDTLIVSNMGKQDTLKQWINIKYSYRYETFNIDTRYRFKRSNIAPNKQYNIKGLIMPIGNKNSLECGFGALYSTDKYEFGLMYTTNNRIGLIGSIVLW